MIACNNSGVWNEQGDTLEFSDRPAYYQTNWFRALCASVHGIALGGVPVASSALHREFNTAIEARVSERTRIARELHDTLLQSLQALLFQYQAARNLFASGSERAMQVLDATIDRTEQAIAESRDAIQDIRSDMVAQSALPELLTRAGSELAESQADQDVPRFGVTVEGERRQYRQSFWKRRIELHWNCCETPSGMPVLVALKPRFDMMMPCFGCVFVMTGKAWTSRSYREAAADIGGSAASESAPSASEHGWMSGAKLELAQNFS